MDNNCRHQQFGHPCFDADAHRSVGRIHLPVAPRCNIKCKYCSRKHDCTNENRPGVTSRIISPEEALERVRLAVLLDDRIRVAGIAGPGDPLANPATFKTLELIRQHFPDLSLCLSTNGLLLPEYALDLAGIGLKSLTVTVNALDENRGANIYSYVQYGNSVLLGVEAARKLRDNQIEGIRLAVSAGLRVKVNSVLIPEINREEMVPIARTMKEMGVAVMNIMPLIPQAEMAHFTPVSDELKQAVRQECSLYIRQISHCRQCRADACGLLEETVNPETWLNDRTVRVAGVI